MSAQQPVTSSASSDAILNSLESAVIVVRNDQSVSFANNAAEQLFDTSLNQLLSLNLNQILPSDSPIVAIIQQALSSGHNVSEYGVTLESPRIPNQIVNIQVSALPDTVGSVSVSIFTRSIADKIDRQMTHRNAARSVTAMAAILAHEVKNPLSGIRGAAQLLEQSAEEDDQKLTRLICDETDRICALVDRIEIFSDQRPLERAPVNIHQVLERVRDVSKTGFAQNAKIVERYDPSLPAVDGNYDQLVQVFLNLVKNAAEAIPAQGGEITISTSYQHGVWLAIPGTSERLQLPLVISVTDNGPGIPEELQDHLFDAFVTSKPKGSGLGLALVSKMINDHGGVIEFESLPGKTTFRVMLPKAQDK